MKAEEIREAKCTYGSSTAEQALVHEARFHGKMLREIAAQLAEGHLSLRDRLAMAAMQGLFSNNADEFWQHDSGSMSNTAVHAYHWADVMLIAKDVTSPVPVPETPQFGEMGLGMNPETGCISNEELAKRDARATLLATPVSDPEKFCRCGDCGAEMERDNWVPIGGTSLCSSCMPF